MDQQDTDGLQASSTDAEQSELSKAEKKARKKEKKARKKKEKAEAKALKKATNTERGIETMFRTAGKNHIQLSQIADNKANIMLTINALIISASFTGLLPETGLHAELRLPLFLLMGVCFVSMSFATVSTLPKVTKGITTREECDRKEGNLLFFGNFHAMERDQYEMAMADMMKDREFLYGSMVRDLYYLGKVLARKYTLLRTSYLVFLIGFTAAVLYGVWAVETAGHVH
ncbi:MAG: DUF5706 domain-containing protein [Flavobacteriales bacterium]|nr:DUF5706 domain-containing protein [Flavobacteriales bacterium]